MATIERRVEAALADAPLGACTARALFDAVWARGVRGLVGLSPACPMRSRALAALEPDDALGPSGDPEPWRQGFEAQLGTVGGGNHSWRSRASRRCPTWRRRSVQGSRRGGSSWWRTPDARGLGHAIGRRSRVGSSRATRSHRTSRTSPAPAASPARTASCSRTGCSTALGAARPDKVAGRLDVTHNDVAREDVGGARRGSTGRAPRRRAGRPTVVLGSRGAPSWVLKATDCEDGLRSVAHGAAAA